MTQLNLTTFYNNLTVTTLLHNKVGVNMVTTSRDNKDLGDIVIVFHSI